MCRSIKKLRKPESLPTDVELHEAALQFIRKVSGMRAPSRVNQQAFDDAVAQVADVTRHMFKKLPVQKTESEQGSKKKGIGHGDRELGREEE